VTWISLIFFAAFAPLREVILQSAKSEKVTGGFLVQHKKD
jgi:hypothetical protein